MSKFEAALTFLLLIVDTLTFSLNLQSSTGIKTFQVEILTSVFLKVWSIDGLLPASGLFRKLLKGLTTDLLDLNLWGMPPRSHYY